MDSSRLCLYLIVPFESLKKTDDRASAAGRDIAHNLSTYSCCSPGFANWPWSSLVLNQCLLYFSKIMERLAYSLHTMTSYLTLRIWSLPIHCTEFTRNISLFLGKTVLTHSIIIGKVRWHYMQLYANISIILEKDVKTEIGR